MLKTLSIDILLVEKHYSTEKFINQIMNAKCFINCNIYHHNDIYSKIINAS